MSVPIQAKPEQKPPTQKPQENEKEASGLKVEASGLKVQTVDLNTENEKHKEAIAAPAETNRLVCGSCGKETKNREQCTECGTEFE